MISIGQNTFLEYKVDAIFKDNIHALQGRRSSMINNATAASKLYITENSVYNYNGLHYIILYYWYYMHK
jgi:hypothetical protein